MSKTLFHVACTTCQARLAVRSESVIGQILGCPKCESMVLITPPRDWQSPPATLDSGLSLEGLAKPGIEANSGSASTARSASIPKAPPPPTIALLRDQVDKAPPKAASEAAKSAALQALAQKAAEAKKAAAALNQAAKTAGAAGPSNNLAAKANAASPASSHATVKIAGAATPLSPVATRLPPPLPVDAAPASSIAASNVTPAVAVATPSVPTTASAVPSTPAAAALVAAAVVVPPPILPAMMAGETQPVAGVWPTIQNSIRTRTLAWSIGAAALFVLGTLTGYLITRTPTEPVVALTPADAKSDATTASAGSSNVAASSDPAKAQTPTEVKSIDSTPAANDTDTDAASAAQAKTDDDPFGLREHDAKVAAEEAKAKAEREAAEAEAAAKAETDDIARDAEAGPPRSPANYKDETPAAEPKSTTESGIANELLLPPLPDVLSSDIQPDMQSGVATTKKKPALTETPDDAPPADEAAAPIDPDAAPAIDEAERTPVVRRKPDEGGATPPSFESRLSARLPAATIDAPLSKFVRLAVDVSALPIRIDSDALMASGISLSSTIHVAGSNIPIAEVLATGLASQKLTYMSDGAALSIVPRGWQPDELKTYTYPVDDLAGDDAASLDRFAEMLRKLVAPKSWSNSASGVKIEPSGRGLQITQTARVHQDLIQLCERIRLARGLPLRSRLPRERLNADAMQIAAPSLARPITVTYPRFTRIGEVLQTVADRSDFELIIDWGSLGEAGFNPTSEISCSLDNLPLAEALSALLNPIDLSWRLIDGRTIEVLSTAKAQDRAAVWLIDVSPLLKGGKSPDEAIALIAESLRRQGLAPADDDTAFEIAYDAPSKRILLRSSSSAGYVAHKASR